MPITATKRTKSLTRAARALVSSGLLLGTLAGCSGLLDVDLPTKVSGDALDNPDLALTLVNSAVGEFECAFSNFVPATGQATDELRHSSGWLVFTLWDERRINADNSSLLCDANIGHGVYVPLQKARVSAESAMERISGWSDAEVPGKANHLAALAAYAAYSRTLLSEVMCQVAFDLGPILNRQQGLATAEEAFTEALALARAAGSAEYENMALVGRARVRNALGDRTGAKADAELVPQGFKKVAEYSGIDRYRYNQTYHHNYVDNNFSVSNEFLDLTFGGVPDPRVRVELAPSLGHNQSLLYRQTKYTGHDPITIASWEEAQLIIAEADLGQTAVDIINMLHAAVGLPDYTPADVSDNAAILAQVIEERSRQLYLEGHRMPDYLRFNIPFASGTSPYTGVTYGTTTCFPLTRAEQSSNPNFTG